VVVVPAVDWEGKAPLVIFAESSLRVGVEGLEPSGEWVPAGVDGVSIADIVA
jgi:hypothetical protein